MVVSNKEGTKNIKTFKRTKNKKANVLKTVLQKCIVYVKKKLGERYFVQSLKEESSLYEDMSSSRLKVLPKPHRRNQSLQELILEAKDELLKEQGEGAYESVEMMFTSGSYNDDCVYEELDFPLK